MPPSLALAITRHVPAFDAPGQEMRLAKRLRKRLRLNKLPTMSVAVSNGEVFALLRFLASAVGRRAYPHAWRAWTTWLYTTATTASTDVAVPECEYTTYNVGVVELLVPCLDHAPTVAVLITFRPQPLLPLSLASARRAVTFVHGFIALVTANAYISTLGGGHFLCLHLAQAKRMARLQIQIADALHDPILKSKCRVNLAYNAMREGRFKRAKRILQQEEQVATQLAHDELEKICIAAHVYMAKTIKLHREFLRQRADLTTKERAVVDNFYRQRILRKAH